MSNERDELAKIIEKALGVVTGIYDTTDAENSELAEKILDAGYRKPRTITTMEELEVLPEGVVIVEGGGCAFQRDAECWRLPGYGDAMADYEIALPVTVLWEPQP